MILYSVFVIKCFSEIVRSVMSQSEHLRDSFTVYDYSSALFLKFKNTDRWISGSAVKDYNIVSSVESYQNE